MKVAVLKGGVAWSARCRCAAGRGSRTRCGRSDTRWPPSTSAPASWPRSRPSARRSPSSPCTARAARTGRSRSCSRSFASPTPVPASGLRTLDRQGRRQARVARCRGADPRLGAFNAVAFRELGAADALEDIEATLGFPLVIKPAPAAPRSGSGSRPARRGARGAVAAFSYDDRVLLERHHEGRELAISLLNGIALPAVEAQPRDEDRFSYEARYEIGRTDYLCPADLGAAEGHVLDAALRTWDVLGFDGFGRVDMILGDDGPQVLEANAVPGLTDTSLLPMAAEAAGLSFERLCDRLLELALERAGRRRAARQLRARAQGTFTTTSPASAEAVSVPVPPSPLSTPAPSSRSRESSSPCRTSDRRRHRQPACRGPPCPAAGPPRLPRIPCRCSCRRRSRHCRQARRSCRRRCRP